MVQECKASDYEEWSPPQRTMCLLGRNYTMQARYNTPGNRQAESCSFPRILPSPPSVRMASKEHLSVQMPSNQLVCLHLCKAPWC